MLFPESKLGHGDFKELEDWYKELRIVFAPKGHLECKEYFTWGTETHFMSNPKSIACGLLYIYCAYKGITLTQKKIHEVINITIQTIRTATHAIQQNLKIARRRLETYNNIRLLEFFEMTK